MVSPESMQEIVIASKADIADGLKARYDTDLLTPGRVKEIPALESHSQVMATYGNPGEGVDQSLRAIIKAGDEFFGIVDVLTISQTTGKTPKFMEDTVITRHLPNQRAELIGFVNRDGKPITIGRSYQDLGIKTSREHFLVIQDMDGAIGIVEPHKTTNGTEVFTPSKNSKFGVSEKLLHMDTVDAVEDFDFWSVKSDDVKARLGSATRLQ